MKRAVVVIGAGASYDVHNGTVPVNNTDLQPPLARQLFDSRFWDFRSSYTGAEVLGAELGKMAQNKSTTFDLEARLTEYAQSSDARTRRAFKDIPPYLRDILVRVSMGYVQSPTNYINLVRRLLWEETHEVMFIVLNYDTLLERALARYDRVLSIDSLDDYVAPRRQAHVVKIHGSTDWAVPIPGTSVLENASISWVQAVDGFEPSSGGGDEILMMKGSDTSQSWRLPGGGPFLYPLADRPAPGEGIFVP